MKCWHFKGFSPPFSEESATVRLSLTLDGLLFCFAGKQLRQERRRESSAGSASAGTADACTDGLGPPLTVGI